MSRIITFSIPYSNFSKHKPAIRKFPRRKTFVPGVYHTLYAGKIYMQDFSLYHVNYMIVDLIDYRNIMRHNSHYKYILCVLDGFSRYAWCRPLKSKHAVDSANALDDILSSLPHSPAMFASDRGRTTSLSCCLKHF